jgi:hypothetical protein
VELFFNPALGKFTRSIGLPAAVTSLRLKARDTQRIDVKFHDGSALVEMPAGLDLVFVIKDGHAADSATLARVDTWTEVAVGHYLALLSLNTAELAGAIGDSASLAAFGELTWSSVAEQWQSSPTLETRIDNDVFKGTEGTPLELPGPLGWLGERVMIRTALEGEPVAAGDFLGQFCRVGDATPYDWYQWDGTAWQDPAGPAGISLTDAEINAIAIRQIPSEAEAAALPLAGPTHALRLDQSRVHRYSVSGDIEFSIFPSGVNTSDRGEFTLIVSFEALTLHAVTFPASWQPLDTSDPITNRLATYVIKGIIVDAKVFYQATEFFAIDEASFVNTLYAVGDLGQDSGPGFAQGVAYLVSKDAEMDLLLYAGDVNYDVGSAADMAGSLGGLSALAAAEKILVTHGNHDLETSTINWTTASSPMALAGTWRWSNSNQFASDFRTNAATSAGWATVTGGVPGFGEVDTGTGAITDNDSLSYYFARVLNLASAPTAGQKLRIRMYIDDGALVYINGVLIYDFNIEYPVSHTSLAHQAMSATVDNLLDYTERGLHEIYVDGAALQAGDNLIAVVVKQSTANSSDVSWAMSIDIGTSTSAIPAWTDEIKYTTDKGQPLRDYFSYLPNALWCYHQTVGDTADIFVMNDGMDNGAKCCNPLTPHATGAMHEWFTAKLAASTRPFKIVMIHRCAVSTYNSSSYYLTALDWPEFKAPGMLLLFGHTHQTCHYSHTSGQHIINASNSGGQAPRAVVALVGATTGYTVDYADASTDYAVARIDISPDLLRVKFERTMDGAVLHQFIISTP